MLTSVKDVKGSSTLDSYERSLDQCVPVIVWLGRVL